MRYIHHFIKITAIFIITFFIEYFLESIAGKSSMKGDFFIIATELLPLVLTFSIFIITWYSYNRNKDNHWLFFGAACFVIGLLDLFHLLSYPFMPDFITGNSLQKSTIFWSEARFVSALLFLASAYIDKDTLPDVINKSVLFISSIIPSAVLLAVTIFLPEIIPPMYSPEGGASHEYWFLVTVSILITAYAGYVYIKKSNKSDQETITLFSYGFSILILSYAVGIFYEYSEHLLRAAGFYFLYLTIYRSSIDQPYERLVQEDETIRKGVEHKYNDLFDKAHDAIITCDLDQHIIVWNKSAEKMFGWTEKEAIGKRLPELIIPPGIRNEIEGIINEALSGRAVVGMDSTNLRKDGAFLDVSITITPLKGADTKINELSYIIQDVTERKQAEMTLQASEKKYSTLVEKGNDGIVIIQGNCLKFVNSKMVEMTGFKRDELIGKLFIDLLPERFRESVKELSGKRFAGEDEIEIISRTGGHIPVEINVTPIEYEGKPADMAIFRDITERRQAEEALSWEIEENAAISELSSTLLSTATIEDISELILDHAKRLTGSKYGYAGYIDPDTGYLICAAMSRDIYDTCKIKYYNNIIKNFKGLFGWVIINRKAILTNTPAGDPRSTGTPPGHIPIHRFLSAPALLRKNLIGQLSIGKKVGNKNHAIRYYDSGKLVGQLALANSDRDYTDRDLSLIERLTDIYAIAINRHRAEVRIKQSLYEKEVLLREIHHRVKNNMQIISSLLSLQSRSMHEEKYKGLFVESQNRIMSMALIHEKLYQSNDLEKIDFKEYINDLVRSLFQSYEVYGSIEPRIEVKDISLGIDYAIPCGLIVNELVTNSIKHAFPDGKKGEIFINFRSQDGGYIQFDVSDNGVGIPGDLDIDKTATLGLHLVILLAKNQLNGEIDLDRSSGTRFIVKFKEVVK